MTYIHAPADSAPAWPYSLAQLRADNPNVSFSVLPTADDLAPFYVFEVQPVEPPATDQRTQRVEEALPELVDGVWQQHWAVRDATPEEIAAYDDANKPRPDWLSFKTAMLSSPDVNAAMGAAMPSAPLAVMSLPAALNAAVAGDTSDFAVTWTTLCQAGLIPQPVIDAVAATAVACHLPEAFVQVLGGEA